MPANPEAARLQRQLTGADKWAAGITRPQSAVDGDLSQLHALAAASQGMVLEPNGHSVPQGALSRSMSASCVGKRAGQAPEGYQEHREAGPEDKDVQPVVSLLVSLDCMLAVSQ